MSKVLAEERILTVEEAAEFCRVSPATVHRWMREGLSWLSANRSVGKRGPRGARIRLSALVRFFEAHETRELPQAPQVQKPPKRTATGQAIGKPVGRALSRWQSNLKPLD